MVLRKELTELLVRVDRLKQNVKVKKHLRVVLSARLDHLHQIRFLPVDLQLVAHRNQHSDQLSRDCSPVAHSESESARLFRVDVVLDVA